MVSPMEKRIGAILIIIDDISSVALLNDILSKHAAIIIARQGIPLRDKKINIISLVVEGSPDNISALTGPLGKLKGIQVKSMMAKQ